MARSTISTPPPPTSAAATTPAGNTLAIGAPQGTSTAKLGGAHYAGALTCSIGALNKSTTFDGPITNSTNPADSASGSNTTLIKTGTLTWNGPGSHTGATTISAGTFILNGTFGRTATQNRLTLTSTQNVLFTLTHDGLGAGTYTLIDGDTDLNSAVLNHNLPATTRQSFSLASSAQGATPPFVRLAVTGSAGNLVWSGAAGSAWNLNNASNWTGGGSTFYNLDTVTFNDTSAVGTVTLTGALQPQDIIVANSAAARSFGGSGSNTLTGILSGTGSLAFNFPGGGLMTLQGNIDAFAGGIPLTGTGGTLRLNPATGGAWGGADIAFDAGTGVINNRATTDVSVYPGALSGSAGSQLRGSDQAGPGLDTYVIGALDTTFAGSISNGSNATPHTTALTKVGTGTLTLAVSGTLVSSLGNLDISNGATLRLASGSVAMDQIAVDSGGSLEGCGTVVADLINNGTVHAGCGMKLIIHGGVVNNGAFRITRGTDFELYGSFTNAGLLDLLTANVSPAILQSIVNQGVILDSSEVRVASANRTNGFSPSPSKATPATHRLQRSATLINPNWSNLGPVQNGNGTILTFNAPAAAGTTSFYRIVVAP